MPGKGKNQLISLATLPLATIGAAFVVASLISVFLVRHHVAVAHMRSLVNQAADAAQFQVNERATDLLKQIDDAANSPILMKLAVSGSAAAIAAEEQQLAEIFPHAIRVRLFPLGGAHIDNNENPPFSYISMDMVNHIETGRGVYPEAINNKGKWVLGFAAPIKAAGSKTVDGTLFVYLDMAAISSGLTRGENGEIKLIQKYANLPSHNILVMGRTVPNAPVVTRALDNPEWRIEFSPSAQILGASISSTIWFLLAPLAFLLIALTGVLLGTRRLLRAVHADAAHLANQMAEVAAGAYRPSTDYGVPVFVDLDANLARLGKRQDEKPSVEPLNVTLQPKETPLKEQVDIEVINEEEFEQAMAQQRGEQSPAPANDNSAVADIFRAYDIRGVVNETLTPGVIRRIGLAIGSEAGEMGQQTLIVGADGRVSSPSVMEALITGLTQAGRDVIRIGTVPTPVLYFATQNSETHSGVMVTASHNPPEYNGFKIVLGGRTLVEADIKRLYRRFKSNDFSAGQGNVTDIDITGEYVDAITDDIVVAQPLKLVVDCGNGAGGTIAPQLFEDLGCDVIALYCDVDGNFPNHSPDPMLPENLKDLILTVKSEGADLGIALDGDADRLVAVTGEGEIVWPDRLLMLFAKDVVSRNPGSDVVYDVKCTRHLNSIISSFGGRPIICRSGHSFVKAKMAETNAVLGGEMSGHICFGERWFGFDDGLYAAARLLEIVGSQTDSLSVLLKQFPSSISTPELHIAVAEADKFTIVDELIKAADFEDGTVTTIDGLRVDFADGWGLVRASNTGPNLTLRFEADSAAALKRIEEKFRELLHGIDTSLDF